MPRKRKEKTYEGHVSKPVRVRRVSAPIRQRETGDGRKDGHIWLSRINKTIQLREEMRNGAKDWKRYYNWFENEMWQERGQEGHTVASDNARNTATVNTVGSIALTFMPFLINGDIKFKLKARKPADTVSSEIQQGLLNYEWQERDCTAECKDIVQDVVVIGHGIGKTGYVVEVDESRRKNEEIEYREYIRQDAAYIERINPLNFLFDLSARKGDLKTARWCAEAFFVPYNDVLDNKEYDQEVLGMISAGSYSLTPRSGWEGMGDMNPAWAKSLDVVVPEDHLVCLFEVWDKKFKKRYIFAEGVPLPLVEEDWPYNYLDGFPYVKIDFIPVSNKPYGMGLYRLCEDQSMQENRLRTAQFLHIRSHGRKFQAVEGAVGPEELTKFTDGPDGTVFFGNIPDAIKPVQDAPMSPDFQIVEARLKADISQRTGQDELAQGGSLPSRTTAAEVGTRTNLLRLKTADRVWAVEQGVTELGSQMLQHLKANRTLEDVVEIVGAQGAYWQEYTPEEIQAEVDVSVEYFAAPKYNPELDRQQRLQIVQLGIQALPAMAQAGSAETLDIPQLFRFALKSFDEPEVGRFFKPALIPVAPLVEGEAATTPAIGGMSAPQPIPEQPTAGMNPMEGLSTEDLLMQFLGNTGQPGGLPGLQ